MAILSVWEIPGDEDSQDEQTARQSARKFRVICDVTGHTPLEIRLAAGIPRVFDICPWDIGQFCVNSVARRDTENPFVWTVDIRYRTVSLNGTQPDQREEDPTERPAEIRVSSESYQKALIYDRDGAAIVNSAGDPFDPPPEVDERRAVITVTKNRPSYSLTTQEEYDGATNEDTYLGFDPGTLRIDLSADTGYENGVYFWKVTANIKINRRFVDEDDEERGGWALEVYDAGYRDIDRNDILDDRGNPIASPAFLGEDGYQLPVGDKPRVLKFEVYRAKSFADLELL